MLSYFFKVQEINLTLVDEIWSGCTEMYNPLNKWPLIISGIDVACRSVSDPSGNLSLHFYRSEAEQVHSYLMAVMLLSLPALSDDISRCISFPFYSC